MTGLSQDRHRQMAQQRDRFVAENPGVQVYRNIQAGAVIEQRTNNSLFYYPELFLEYIPSRNGSLSTFYANYNNVESRRVGEFLFATENEVRIEGDLSSRFQRASNRLNQRRNRNTRPILINYAGKIVRMVVVAIRNIATGEEIIL